MTEDRTSKLTRKPCCRGETGWGDATIIFQDGGGCIEFEIAPFDPPTLKTYPRTKFEVDRITRCVDGDMAI